MKSKIFILIFLFLAIKVGVAQHLVYYNNFENIVIDDVNSSALKPAGVFALTGSPDLIQFKYNKVYTSPFGYFKGPCNKGVIIYDPIKPRELNCLGLFFNTHEKGIPESIYFKIPVKMRPSDFNLKFYYSVYDLSSHILLNSIYIKTGIIDRQNIQISDSFLVEGPFLAHNWDKIDFHFKSSKEFNVISISRNFDTRKNIKDTCTAHIRRNFYRVENSSYLLFDDIELYDLNGVNPKIEKDKRKPAKHIVYFKTDSYEVIEGQRDSLLKFLDRNSKYNVERIEIIGYADSVGTDKYNQKLANNRVKSVQDLFLVYKEKLPRKVLQKVDLNENKRSVEVSIIFKE